MKDGKEAGECPHMKDGKPCNCPQCKAARAAQGDKAGKQPAKMGKPMGKKGAKAPAETEAKATKE
jgi:hypothetical protein